MVDSIDKALPNTVEEVKDEEFKEKEVAIPGEQIVGSDTTEVVMDEEGGAGFHSIQQRSLVDNQMDTLQI
jgi:hypothetical protein